MTTFVVVALLLSAPLFPASAQRQVEALGRGVVAVRQADGRVWVGWRLSGTDPEGLAFNLYRSTEGARAVRLNDRPIDGPTNFVDANAAGSKSHSYFVRPILKGREREPSAASTLQANAPARQYPSIPLQTPKAYAPGDASAGDLDGDGEYELVVHILSDLDPGRPGLEVFDIQERFDDAGAHFRDARTGKVLWKKPSAAAGPDGEGPGRGLCLDIDPRYSGFECWVRGADIVGLFDARGELISKTTPRSCNFGVYRDGDTLGELLDRNYVAKWDWKSSSETVLLTAEGCTWDNGSEATPALSADILGDWREEIIWRTVDNRELRVYTTTIPTAERFYTFTHDPQYRLSVAWQNVGYNQPPHTSFFVGEGMKRPPRPNIVGVRVEK